MTQHAALLAAAAAAAAALAASGPAPAQTETNAEAVARCRALPTAAERFGCLEEFVLREEPAPEAAPPPSAPPPVAPPVGAPPVETPAVAAAPAAAPAPAPTAAAEPDERRGFFRRPRVPFIGGGGEESGAEPARAVVATTGGDELGAEQLAEPGERARLSETRYAFEVAEVGESFFGGLQVELENGQVWRQQRDDGTRILMLADESIDSVEIWQSARFGGYRMRLPDRNRTIRVERVR